ncbi:CAMK/CAMKL/CHK1 protein kinase Chk1 [Schizosaccharomyces cryophilus OY26]|uniref:non-specific serine/threonine protein kinase n=1 Tax=Schizosaccharomyces cryophilus (strain OY26 / ATCC MYA-4695 / CBS 11777 / NBRC 106824 / NRRL Y48691) TaxID=653667 RepID=S9WYA9_SCHCR|nr:CAMK/CAMKL/CHK1 protein kinase Chk1 [Schizosaccharomyces cryophilus OY26]EPY49717.1 CAMK/CAMKL/CHK1 protein kinase Chk1 [Schizosaccharomyces cryophilus OY26]
MTKIIEKFPYHIGKEIGTGAFASVRICYDDNAKIYAVKFINKKFATKCMGSNVWARRMASEVQLHRLCNGHKNIIHFYDTAENSHWRWVTLEFAQGGDLFDKIEPEVGIDEDVAQFYFAQLMEGISFMHSKGVAHRDLKPENILLDYNGNLKLSDFGFASLYAYKGKTRLLNSPVGSPPYAAPEITGQYDGAKVDIWSCGIILFALLSGNTPWDEAISNTGDYLIYRKQGERPSSYPWNRLSPGAYSIITGMLRSDPSKRFSIRRILQHPWLTSNTSFRTDNGNCSDPVALASRLMLKLHIDLDKPRSSLTDTSTYGNISMTQPTTKVSESDIHNHTAIYGYLSQPVQVNEEVDVTELMEKDPSLSQFSNTNGFIERLAGKAKNFYEICPPERLTRFYSKASKQYIIDRLYDTLRLLAVSLTTKHTSGQSTLYVKLHDKRKCLLQGEIELKTLGHNLELVNFIKSSGDPLEWRNFFKNVVSSLGKPIVLTDITS